MPREGSDDVTRDNWTRRFSKTVLANLVPFRKVVTSDEAKSPPSAAAASKVRRRASAAPDVLLAAGAGAHHAAAAAAAPEISALHKLRQRRRSADRIYALKSNQVRLSTRHAHACAAFYLSVQTLLALFSLIEARRVR
ncbi:hypothetical protein Aduo_014962 [Ancylostoma duodenale]